MHQNLVLKITYLKNKNIVVNLGFNKEENWWNGWDILKLKEWKEY